MRKWQALMFILPLLLWIVLAQAQTAEGIEEKAETVKTKVEELKKISNLPDIVKDARDAGTEEGEIQKIVTGVKDETLTTEEGAGTIKAMKANTEAGKTNEGISEFVHQQKEKGVTGRELGQSIKEELKRKHDIEKAPRKKGEGKAKEEAEEEKAVEEEKPDVEAEKKTKEEDTEAEPEKKTKVKGEEEETKIEPEKKTKIEDDEEKTKIEPEKKTKIEGDEEKTLEVKEEKAPEKKKEEDVGVEESKEKTKRKVEEKEVDEETVKTKSKGKDKTKTD